MTNNISILSKKLQALHDEMGASAYQNVRNPIPMRKLVTMVLPTIKKPTTNPKVFSHALTVNGVVDKLKAMGFLANRGGVACHLNAKNNVAIKKIGGRCALYYIAK
jgi:hypothetical protein